jgi:hypothetical protein
MEDSQTGETYTITTDKVVASTGLGTPDFGFRDMDEATRELCSADDGRVQTYGQFLSELGDRSNPFPLKRYVNKRVLIIGGGNSGLTVAEGLAGLAPEYRGSVSSLGGPSQITILGTKFTDDKSFISTEIPRYAQLASLMRKAGPAADANTRSQLVVPVTGVRAVRLSEKNMSSSGNELPPIIVHCEEKGGGTGGKDMEADIVIVTTGFTTEQHQIFKNLLPPDSTASTTFSENLEDMRVAESSHPVGRNLKGEKDIVFIGPAADMPINDREKKAADLFNRSRSAVALPNTAEDTLWYARAMVGEEVRKGERREAPWLHETSGPQTTIETGSFTELSFVISADTSEERLPPEIRYEELLRLSKLSHTPRAITSPREPFETTLQVEQVDGQQYKITSDTPIPGSYKQMLTDFLADTYTQVAILRLLDKRHSHGRPLRISFPD